MSIPFLDLGATYRELRAEIDEAVGSVLASGWYVLGTEVAAFEAEFAAYTDAAHCVGVGNGLDALELALRACGVGPGDEVIVPSNTYIATWLGVSALGAIPVPVEPDPRTYNLDPSAVEAALTARTRAILPVHLYGSPADLGPLLALASTHGLKVVDDAAQAHGARLGGRRIGGLADVTAWSFYPGTNLGAFGDGGAVTTNDSALADRISTLRNYGSRVKYHNEERGLNSRLDELQAAALRVKLRHLDEWNDRRRAIAAIYDRELADTGLVLPARPIDTEPVWHLYVVQSRDRDALQRDLADLGVQTLIHYPVPPHLQPAYADLGLARGQFPVAEHLHDHVLSLPIGPHLRSEQVDRVVEAVRASCTGA